MWSSRKAAHRIAARLVLAHRPRAILAGIVAAFALTIAAPNQAAAQVQYVRICSLYGAGFFYIPGTDTCTNANQIIGNQFGIARLNTLSSTGTAMAASLVAPWLPTGTNYAISNHWANFNGQNGVGVSGLMRLSGNLVFSAGFAAGLDTGSLTALTNRTQTEFGTSVQSQSWSDVRGLTRAGFMYAW
jgi:Porin subfamily